MKSKILLMSMLAMAVMFSSCGGDDDDEDDKVEPVFQARFTYDGGLRRPAPAKVVFDNNSDLATSYKWEFGDGDTSTVESPTHTYEEAGTYQVKLTAYNDAGEERTRETEIVIYDQPTHIKVKSITLRDAGIEEAELSEGQSVYLRLKDASGSEIDYNGKGSYSGTTVSAYNEIISASFSSTHLPTV